VEGRATPQGGSRRGNPQAAEGLHHASNFALELVKSLDPDGAQKSIFCDEPIEIVSSYDDCSLLEKGINEKPCQFGDSHAASTEIVSAFVG
jgi:hypothetical protein